MKPEHLPLEDGEGRTKSVEKNRRQRPPHPVLMESDPEVWSKINLCYVGATSLKGVGQKNITKGIQDRYKNLLK